MHGVEQDKSSAHFSPFQPTSLLANEYFTNVAQLDGKEHMFWSKTTWEQVLRLHL